MEVFFEIVNKLAIWGIAVAIDGFSIEMCSIVLKFFLNVYELGIELIILFFLSLRVWKFSLK